MNHLQARDMKEFKSSKHAYGCELWKLENNKNTARTGHHHHHRLSEDPERRRVRDYYPPPSSNRVSSSSTANTTHNKNKNKRAYQIQRKSSWINDPELKRQTRVVKYKAYAVEGKVKASLRNGVRWVKNKYIQLVHGYY